MNHMYQKFPQVVSKGVTVHRTLYKPRFRFGAPNQRARFRVLFGSVFFFKKKTLYLYFWDRNNFWNLIFIFKVKLKRNLKVVITTFKFRFKSSKSNFKKIVSISKTVRDRAFLKETEPTRNFACTEPNQRCSNRHTHSGLRYGLCCPSVTTGGLKKCIIFCSFNWIAFISPLTRS